MRLSFHLSVHGGGGGVPVSHNVLQHFPECHGAAWEVTCQVQLGGYPGGGGGYPGGGGTLEGGALPGGYPGRGYPALGGTLPGGTLPWGGTLPGGVPS